MVTDQTRIADTVALIESALFGDEPRRGIWTDRDYLVHALAILTNSGRAQRAAIARPKALLDSNKPLKQKDEPWWTQYEKSAAKLEFLVEQWDNHSVANFDPIALNLAADDIRTLVAGLRDLERKLGETSGPDPALKIDARR